MSPLICVPISKLSNERVRALSVGIPKEELVSVPVVLEEQPNDPNVHLLMPFAKSKHGKEKFS